MLTITNIVTLQSFEVVSGKCNAVRICIMETEIDDRIV